MTGLMVTIAHRDPRSETVAFECHHGTSTQTSVTDTSEALDLVTRLLEAKHRADHGCDCRLVAMQDYWVNWADARALWEADAVNGTRRRLPPRQADFFDTILKALREEGCASCNAGMLLRFSVGGPDRMTLVHGAGCPREHVPPRVIMA